MTTRIYISALTFTFCIPLGTTFAQQNPDENEQIINRETELPRHTYNLTTRAIRNGQ